MKTHIALVTFALAALIIPRRLISDESEDSWDEEVWEEEEEEIARTMR